MTFCNLFTKRGETVLKCSRSYLMSASNDDAAKRIAKMMVVLNRTFSKPLRVWWLPPKLSPPPKAPPTPASLVCSIIAVTIRMAKTIWI